MEPTLNLVMDGARLSAVGMGTVFLFLGLLVIATTLMSKLIVRFTPAPQDPPDVPEVLAPGHPHFIPVVSAAIHAHRSKRQP